MFWKDITEEHHGSKVSVSARSTLASPHRGEGPFVGYISCPKPGAFPVLHVGDEVRFFAWFWEVEFIDKT